MQRKEEGENEVWNVTDSSDSEKFRQWDWWDTGKSREKWLNDGEVCDDILQRILGREELAVVPPLIKGEDRKEDKRQKKTWFKVKNFGIVLYVKEHYRNGNKHIAHHDARASQLLYQLEDQLAIWRAYLQADI